MRQIFLCVLSLSLSGALTGAVILLVRPFTRRWFSKRWNYYIWLLVVARLLVPVYLETGYSFTLAEDMGAKIAQETGNQQGGALEGTGEPVQEEAQKGKSLEKAVDGAGKDTEETQETDNTQTNQGEGRTHFGQVFSFPGTEDAVDIGAVLAAVWFLGMTVSLFLKIKDYRCFFRRIKESWKPVPDCQVKQETERLCARISMKKRPDIYESREVFSPLAIGLCRPVIVLPKEERSIPEFSLVLHHELVHVKRKDLWYKWLYQILLCIHWFNPVLYLIEKKLNTDCELSCDEAVLGALTQEGKKAYGNALLDAAERNVFWGRQVSSPMLFSRKEDLKVRLKGILQYKKQNGFKILVSLCVSAMLVLLTACGSVQVSPDSLPVHISRESRAEYGSDSFWESEDSDAAYFDDLAEARYVPFWERAAIALGTWLEDGLDGLDGFLSQPVIVDKSGKAWQVYDDDGMIAGEDISSQWHMYSYRGGQKIKCDGMFLNGDASVLIAYAKRDGDYQVHSAFEELDGRFKVVHIGPDGEVTVINETGEESWTDVAFKEGRNVIKFVGQGAKIRNLKMEYSDLHERDFEGIFYSQQDEEGMILTAQIKMGTADKEKVMELMPYLDEETVSEALALFLEQKIPLSEEEMEKLLMYSDSSLAADYLVQALENGDIRPLSEEMVLRICPYLEGGALKELLAAMNESLTIDLAYRCAPYLNDDELKEVLQCMGDKLTGGAVYKFVPYLDGDQLMEVLISMGPGLTVEEAYQCAPYLGEGNLAEVLISMDGRLTAELVCQCAPYLGGTRLREVLLSMEEGMTFELLCQCAPYLGSSNLEKCLKKYLEDGNEMSYSQYNQISPYLGGNAAERLEKVKPLKPLAE